MDNLFTRAAEIVTCGECASYKVNELFKIRHCDFGRQIKGDSSPITGDCFINR